MTLDLKKDSIGPFRPVHVQWCIGRADKTGAFLCWLIHIVEDLQVLSIAQTTRLLQSALRSSMGVSTLPTSIIRFYPVSHLVFGKCLEERTLAQVFAITVRAEGVAFIYGFSWLWQHRY